MVPFEKCFSQYTFSTFTTLKEIFYYYFDELTEGITQIDLDFYISISSFSLLAYSFIYLNV